MARHPNPNPNPNSHPNPNPYPNPRRSRSCSRASPPCRSSIFLPTVRHRSSLTPTPTPTLTLSLTPTLTLTLTPTPTRTLTLPLTRPLLGRRLPRHHLHLPLRLGAKGQPLRRRRRRGRAQVSAAMERRTTRAHTTRAPHGEELRRACSRLLAAPGWPVPTRVGPCRRVRGRCGPSRPRSRRNRAPPV